MDLIFNCVGGDSLSSLPLLKENGSFLTIANMSVFQSPSTAGYFVSAVSETRKLEKAAELYSQGKLKVLVSHTYSLSQGNEAHKQSESQRTVGKIVFTN